MPASVPGPSSGAVRIPPGADHVREDHLAELVLHVAQRQAGEDGLAEVPEPGRDRRGGDPGECLDDIPRITGDSHRLGGRGRWLQVRHSVRVPPLLRARVRCGDRARAGQPRAAMPPIARHHRHPLTSQRMPRVGDFYF